MREGEARRLRMRAEEDDDRSSSGRASFSEPTVRSRVITELMHRTDLVEVLKRKLDTCISSDALEEVCAAMVNAGMFAAEEEEAATANLLSCSADMLLSSMRSPASSESTTPGTSPMAATAWKKAAQTKGGGGVGLARQTSQPLLGRKSRTHSHVDSAASVQQAVLVHQPVTLSMEARLAALLEEPSSSPEVAKFVAYLESVFAVENFNFLKDVAAFVADCNSNATVKSKERKAKKIYETYFVSSSPSMINLSHRASAPVANRFGPLTAHLFDQAVKAVQQNLQDDLLVRYVDICSKEAATLAADEDDVRPGLLIRKQSKLSSTPTSPPDDQQGFSGSPASSAVAYESMAVTANPLLALSSSPPTSPVAYESLHVIQNPLLSMKSRKSRAQSEQGE